MTREQLIEEALHVGRNSKHNLELIRKQPEKMLPGKSEEAERYLNRMIRLSETEIKNARLAGRTLKLRKSLKILVDFILSPSKLKGKGENA